MAKRDPKKFTRGSIGGHRRNVRDERGTIQIRVQRVDGRGRIIPGNVTRSCTVRDATVSVVFSNIEKALFT